MNIRKLTTSIEATSLVGAVLVASAFPSVAVLIYVILGVYALWGPERAVKALAVSFVLNLLNPGLVGEEGAAISGRFIVIAGAVISVCGPAVFTKKPVLVLNKTIATLALGVLLIVHSVFVSPHLGVSVLKAVAWTATTVTLIRAWALLSDIERTALATHILSGLALLMLASLPLLSSSVGYLRNETGFQGVLNHPQVFGATMALLAAWIMGRVLASSRPSWLALGILAASVVLVFLSEARTAGFALFFGVSMAVALVLLRSRSTVRSDLPGLVSRRLLPFAIGALFIGVVGATTLVERIEAFVVKRGEATSLHGAYEVSRGRAITAMWANIQDSPLSGIGFGISSDASEMEIKREPVLGLPVGAAVEKGVLPIAILEELGLFGFFGVAAWIWVLLRKVAKAGIEPLSVSVTALLLNIGEATLFSVGGLGLLVLIILTWASACGPSRENEAAQRKKYYRIDGLGNGCGDGRTSVCRIATCFEPSRFDGSRSR